MKLIHLTHIKPNIIHAVNVLSQFMHDPQASHFLAVYKVLRYLKGTMGLVSHLRDKVQWRSMCALTLSMLVLKLILVYNRLLHLLRREPDYMEKHKAEGRIRALCHGIREALWIGETPEELKITYEEPIRPLCDIKSAINIARYPVYHDRTKHVNIDCHFIKEKLQDKIITTLHTSYYYSVQICSLEEFQENSLKH